MKTPIKKGLLDGSAAQSGMKKGPAIITPDKLSATGFRAKAQQVTFDHLDQTDEQRAEFGDRHSEAYVVKFDATALAEFDLQTIRQGLMDDNGVQLIAGITGWSKEAAVDHVIALVEQGHMTLGLIEGKIRSGITKDGWKAYSKIVSGGH